MKIARIVELSNYLNQMYLQDYREEKDFGIFGVTKFYD